MTAKPACSGNRAKPCFAPLKPYAVVVCLEMLLCIVVCAYCLSFVEKRRGVLYAANVQQNFSAIVLLGNLCLKMLISHLIP